MWLGSGLWLEKYLVKQFLMAVENDKMPIIPFYYFLSFLFFIHYFSSPSPPYPSRPLPLPMLALPIPTHSGKLGHERALGRHERERERGGVGDRAPFFSCSSCIWLPCGASLLNLFQVWTFGWRGSKATGGEALPKWGLDLNHWSYQQCSYNGGFSIF